MEEKNELVLLKEQVLELKKKNAKLENEIKQSNLILSRANSIQQQFESYRANQQLENEIKDKNINAFLKYCPSIIFLVSKNGYITFTTYSLVKVLGLESEKEVLNKSVKSLTCEIMDNGWVTTLVDKVKAVFETQVSLSYYDKVTFNDKKYYEIFFQINPVESNKETLDNVLVVMSDNTDIIQQKLKAESASRAKGDFLSNMSHEIRTPLNAIIGMTNIAKATNNGERKEYCLDKIKEASIHLLGVINDILDMNKIEANKLEISKAPFNFEKMIIKTTDVINFKIDEKKQEFLVQMDHTLHNQVISDSQRLSQVITNLLSNAVKFTPEYGKISLIIEKVFESEESLIIRVSVKDTGIGITDEQMGRLFHSFEQADGSISRKFGGTGLGLAISKKIIEALGGSVEVASIPGEGSTFSFTTVLEKDYTPVANKLVDKDVNWKNLRVLAVDDAFEIREYFMDIADALGFQCEVASDGFSALLLLEMHKNDPYHIIFSDWRMPGMNGIELSRNIKKIAPSNTIVLMSSTTEWAELSDEATKAGITTHIPKPLFSSQIVDCINQCLGNEKIADSSDLIFTNLVGKLGKYTILLAEDIEINQEIVISALEDTKVKIECAGNGKIAYQMFLNHPDKYDIIFMDIHMPEQDGYETTRKIRALDLEKAKSIPIIAMTANVFKEDVERCLKVGMNDHIGKPLDFEKIMEKLVQYLPVKEE